MPNHFDSSFDGGDSSISHDSGRHYDYLGREIGWTENGTHFDASGRRLGWSDIGGIVYDSDDNAVALLIGNRYYDVDDSHLLGWRGEGGCFYDERGERTNLLALIGLLAGVAPDGWSTGFGMAGDDEVSASLTTMTRT